MQRKISIFLASALLTSSLLAFDAQVTAESLNIRAIPNVHGKIVGTAHKDERYHIISKHNGWYQIAPQRWIFAKHTKEIGSASVSHTLHQKKNVVKTFKREEKPLVMHKFGETPDNNVRDDSIDADLMA